MAELFFGLFGAILLPCLSMFSRMTSLSAPSSSSGAEAKAERGAGPSSRALGPVVRAFRPFLSPSSEF